MGKIKLNSESLAPMIVLIGGIIILIISGFYYFSNNREEDNGGKKIITSVSIDNLMSVTPGDLIMNADSILFCVKNHPRNEGIIICYSSVYGIKYEVFPDSPGAKKIVKIIKKDDPEYCEAAKKFLSIQ